MKIFKKIALILVYLLFVFVVGLLCTYYSHPNYVEQKLATYFPNLKIKTSLFINRNKCSEFECVSDKLNNKYREYIWNSAFQKFGEPLKNSTQIKQHVLNGSLVFIESNDLFVVDTLYYSYAFLTPNASILLNEIAQNFQNKLKNTTFKETKIHVTSLLRTLNSVKRLRKWNKNSLRISSHLHGTTFDLDYDNFEIKDTLTPSSILYLKEILASTLKELQDNKKCYVTYEVRQTCFHVVSRKK